MTVAPMYSTGKCVICAADLDPQALKCTTCGSFQSGHECEYCHLLMPADAKRCPACKELRVGTNCIACGETIDSRKCPKCDTWQTSRRFVPASQVTLALIVAILSTGAAIFTPIYNYWSNRSNSQIRVIGDYAYLAPGAIGPENTIRVLVKNSGKRESVIGSASITFDPVIHAAPTQLDMMNKDTIIVKPGEAIYLLLTAPTVLRMHGRTKKEILDAANISNRYATIRVVIVETNRKDKAVDTTRENRIETKKILRWMRSHVRSET